MAQVGFNAEKNGGRKFRWTVPLMDPFTNITLPLSLPFFRRAMNLKEPRHFFHPNWFDSARKMRESAKSLRPNLHAHRASYIPGSADIAKLCIQ